MPGMFELMFSVLLSLLCIFVVSRSHRLSERSPQSRILFSIAVALVFLPYCVTCVSLLGEACKTRNSPSSVTIFAVIIIGITIILFGISIRPSTWKGWTGLALLVLAVCCIGTWGWMMAMMFYMGSYNPLELAKYIGPTNPLTACYP